MSVDGCGRLIARGTEVRHTCLRDECHDDHPCMPHKKTAHTDDSIESDCDANKHMAPPFDNNLEEAHCEIHCDVRLDCHMAMNVGKTRTDTTNFGADKGLVSVCSREHSGADTVDLRVSGDIHNDT